MARHFHPNALVESSSIGDGTVIWAFAHVMPRAVVGDSCKIGDHVFIEDGAVLGDRVTVKNNALVWYGVTIDDDAFIGPNVVFTNDLRPRSRAISRVEDWVPTRVGRGASIGANVTILAGVTIGAWAMIGAGSVITSDVADHALVFGSPARLRGWVCVCGSDIDLTPLACLDCGSKYRRDGDAIRPAAIA